MTLDRGGGRWRYARTTEAGLTLVELMVVVAIIGILTTAAAVMIKPVKPARGFADALASLMDTARERAISSRRIQQVEITADEATLYEADDTGMATPSGYTELRTIETPAEIQIFAVETVARPVEGNTPAEGDGLDAEIDFAPDGTALSALTIYITDANERLKSRIVVYPATGTVQVLDGW